MLSPQAVSADSTALFNLLAILSDPKAYTAQLEALKKAADEAKAQQEAADRTLSAALGKEQELRERVVAVERQEAVSSRQIEKAIAEAGERTQKAAQISDRAIETLSRADAQATEILRRADQERQRRQEEIDGLIVKVGELEKRAEEAEGRLEAAESARTEALKRLGG